MTIVNMLVIIMVCYLNTSVAKYSIKGIDEDVLYDIAVMPEFTPDVARISLKSNNSPDFNLDISNVRGIERVTIHEEQFIEVKFLMRGGSGVKIRRTMVLCAKKDKLFTCFDLISDVVSRVTQVYEKKADSLKLFDEKEDYHLSFQAKRKSNNLLEASLTESKIIDSKNNPTNNLKWEKKHELYFDSGGLFFLYLS